MNQSSGMDLLDRFRISQTAQCRSSLAICTSIHPIVTSRADVLFRPPNLVIDAQTAFAPYMSDRDSAAGRKALDALFKASGSGPALATCFLELEDCTLASIRQPKGISLASVTCNVQGKCRPLTSV